MLVKVNLNKQVKLIEKIWRKMYWKLNEFFSYVLVEMFKSWGIWQNIWIRPDLWISGANLCSFQIYQGTSYVLKTTPMITTSAVAIFGGLER